MGRQEVLAERAKVATQVALLMTDPAFYSDLVGKDTLDTDGTIPMIVAAESESAVVAMHRFDRMGVMKVIMATNKGPDSIELIGLRKSEHDGSEGSDRTMDIVGGITVRGWIELMREDPSRGYTMTGSDVLPFADTSLYATATAGQQSGSY